jgi:hypothetical protein
LRAFPAYTFAVLAHGSLTSGAQPNPFEPSLAIGLAKLFLFVALATFFQWLACLLTPKARPLLPSAVAIFFSVALGLTLALGPIVVSMAIAFASL